MVTVSFGKTQIIGGASTPSLSQGVGQFCRNCFEAGLLAKMSSSSVSPQFTFRYWAFELYIGGTLSGTSDTVWASANKYSTYNSALYLAEVDSYSFDISTYLVQPELGFRIYFTPSAAVSPYLNLGTFFIVPILNQSYWEKFCLYDTTGTLYRTMDNSSSSGPQLSTTGLYEIGIHTGIGAQYQVNQYFAIFAEFGVRYLLGGADIKYDYSRLIETQTSYEEVHNWLGGASISAVTATGYLGAQFYW